MEEGEKGLRGGSSAEAEGAVRGRGHTRPNGVCMTEGELVGGRMESAWPRESWSEAIRGRGGQAEGSSGAGGCTRPRGSKPRPRGAGLLETEAVRGRGEQAEGSSGAGGRTRPRGSKLRPRGAGLLETEAVRGRGELGSWRPNGSHPPEERRQGPYSAEAELGSGLRRLRGSSGAVESLQESWSAAEGSLCCGPVMRGERTETLRGGRELGEGGARLGEGVKPPCVVVTEGVGGDRDDIQNRLRRLGAGHLKSGNGAVRSWGSGAR